MRLLGKVKISSGELNEARTIVNEILTSAVFQPCLVETAIQTDFDKVKIPVELIDSPSQTPPRRTLTDKQIMRQYTSLNRSMDHVPKIKRGLSLVRKSDKSIH